MDIFHGATDSTSARSLRAVWRRKCTQFLQESQICLTGCFTLTRQAHMDYKGSSDRAQMGAGTVCLCKKNWRKEHNMYVKLFVTWIVVGLEIYEGCRLQFDSIWKRVCQSFMEAGMAVKAGVFLQPKDTLQKWCEASADLGGRSTDAWWGLKEGRTGGWAVILSACLDSFRHIGYLRKIMPAVMEASMAALSLSRMKELPCATTYGVEEAWSPQPQSTVSQLPLKTSRLWAWEVGLHSRHSLGL